ncbi:glutamate-1-semialdehyde-2,1-aminomutase [Methanoplanus sp. FWC-SCC4]|uniref:Glutamate-1-semialdehyde 2,1-aminomutase n=1 Tax=Methanochimaera problematica TaxID=2609417 RepID=A0AA97FEC0_9EURY|nr:glutamate-1-semialdehyde 2,1-aminomutase [Methanoplanus sp. FWC-SCC4]WOF15891.1 glutamate-1-semialdehyde-2,1-aminomutase [Methanoplanus sp. FWC-SCC4]
MKSSELFETAKTLIPGGVSSPVRAIKPYPFYTKRAEGSKIYTEDGDSLIDCCMGYGPLLLGHAHPFVKSAIKDQLDNGWLFGTPAEAEIKLAKIVTGDHPSMDMCRFVSSGSEATMAAIRLARGYSGKKDIIKVEGGFHGAHDGVLIQAGSGATTMGVPDSAGVIPEIVSHTAQVPYNDIESLENLLAKNNNVAAFIIEPVMGNIGPILPEDGYLKEVRKITEENDVLLICDEVICGYRLGIGGAQVKYDIKPDITTLGKIVGGGLPIGVFGGRREIMEMVAPAGPVYQAGTFSGNPLTLASGIAMLNYIHDNSRLYERLDGYTKIIHESLPEKYRDSFVRLGSIFKLFFREKPPKNYVQAKESNTEKYADFWKKMLQSGVFLPPSQFETNFVSAAHTEEDIEYISGAYNKCL